MSIDLTYERRYPCTVNDPGGAAARRTRGHGVAGPDKVDPKHIRILVAEDFVSSQNESRGAYAFIGNGPITEDRGPVHNAAYEFNDDIIGAGAQFLAQVAQDAIADRRSR